MDGRLARLVASLALSCSVALVIGSSVRLVIGSSVRLVIGSLVALWNSLRSNGADDHRRKSLLAADSVCKRQSDYFEYGIIRLHHHRCGSNGSNWAADSVYKTKNGLLWLRWFLEVLFIDISSLVTLVIRSLVVLVTLVIRSLVVLVTLVIRSLVVLVISSLVVLVIGSSFEALVIGSSLTLWIALSSPRSSVLFDFLDSIFDPYDSSRSNGAGDSWSKSDLYLSFPADSAFVPKSSVYSEIGRIGLGIRTSLPFFFELCFPELALAIDLSKVSICISVFGMVALAEISLQVRVKKHGQGQSSSGPAGGSGAGNAGGSIGGGGGDENGTIGHGTGQGRRSGIGGGGRGQGNGDDDDNDGRRIVGNVGNGRRPRNPTPEVIATIFLPIIMQSIANLMSLINAELSTTGRANLYFSLIINLVGFICCAAVIWQPYTNPRVARILNPRISGILSRSGSALAFLGFISMMGIDLPLYLSWIMVLAFLVFLAIFLVDISEA